MPFRVVIVGGSVSGLTLAKVLEKFDIDHVVLEAHATIAPQLGASIGLVPSGLQSLDQLGSATKVSESASGRTAITRPRCVGSTATSGVTGYPQLFIDRQMLLQTLFDSLESKEKVRTNKRVTRVDPVDGGVRVCTEDGSEYTGDIVVGAGGIHSAVRREMWRNAREAGSEHSHLDEESRIQAESK
ncbi:hypothetical protein LQW54_002759 [Pestalotiopsis sp. IQ-011]